MSGWEQCGPEEFTSRDIRGYGIAFHCTVRRSRDVSKLWLAHVVAVEIVEDPSVGGLVRVDSPMYAENFASSDEAMAACRPAVDRMIRLMVPR